MKGIDFSTFIALIDHFQGLLGVLLGILVTRYFNWIDRNSTHSDIIFTKKLELYEELYGMLQKAYEEGEDIMVNKHNMDSTERLSIWSVTVLRIAKFLDDHKLYIEMDLSAHCLMSLISVEEVADIHNIVKRKKLEKEFRRNWQATYNIIKERSGIRRIEGFLKKINSQKETSGYIQYYEEQLKKLKK